MNNSIKIITSYVILLFTIVAFSCKNNLPNPVPVEFEFRLLNEQGQPSTTFKEGENFVFSFLMINKSNETWYLRGFDYEDRQDFFRVYQIGNAETDSLLDLGQPHKGMFCDKIGGIQIEAGDTLKFETPWTVPEFYYPNGLLFCFGQNAEPLERGSYRTLFSKGFYFFVGDKSIETDILNFSIDFTIN